MLQRVWTADARGVGPDDRGGALRVGIVCPYSLDVPGGVQSHVLDLARALIALGHSVSVLAPADDERADGDPPLPAFVTPAGRAVSVPYNGSVARVTFGPVSYARVRRWLAEHTFDVLHLHEPGTFSLSSLALFEAEGPIVATFHTSTERSRAHLGVRPADQRADGEGDGADRGVPDGAAGAGRAPGRRRGGDPQRRRRRPVRAAARCCPATRATGTRSGSSAASASRARAWRCCSTRCAGSRPPGPACGCSSWAAATPTRCAAPPGPELADRLDVLGGVDDATKAAALRSMDVYCAPNMGGESFGMVLTEAMAAGAPVLASDLGAFRAVLSATGIRRRRSAGVLFPTGDARALAAELAALLDDPQRRAALGAAARARAAAFDWPVVAADVLRVYRAAIAADPRRVPGRTAAGTR